MGNELFPLSIMSVWFHCFVGSSWPDGVRRPGFCYTCLANLSWNLPMVMFHSFFCNWLSFFRFVKHRNRGGVAHCLRKNASLYTKRHHALPGLDSLQRGVVSFNSYACYFYLFYFDLLLIIVKPLLLRTRGLPWKMRDDGHVQTWHLCSTSTSCSKWKYGLNKYFKICFGLHKCWFCWPLQQIAD